MFIILKPVYFSIVGSLQTAGKHKGFIRINTFKNDNIFLMIDQIMGSKELL